MGKFLFQLRQLSFFCTLRKFIPNFVINYLYHLPKACLAVLYYRYPAKKLTVIGVTGTDGKTTTSTLIYEILKKARKKAALISTVSAKIGNQDLPTGLHVTSPDPWELQRLLRLIVDKGFKYVVVESTSHGFDQFRLFGCNYQIGVITNVTHEHLDYHETMKNYLGAKAKLFRGTKVSILNKDDQSFYYLKKRANGKIISYGLKNADFTPKTFLFKTNLLGDYNLHNCLAAIACAKALEINDNDIRLAVLGFKGVIGRMNEIKMGQKFRVFVDFAHTPNGLKSALSALKGLKPKKLIAVFGCAGLRDVFKRPMMGEIACRLADKIILTAEDPRTEDVNKIISQITSGCQNKSKLIKEPDRQKAINLACQIARPGDIVGIFGKGHEKSLCIGKTEYPWSDFKAVNKAIKLAIKK